MTSLDQIITSTSHDDRELISDSSIDDDNSDSQDLISLVLIIAFPIFMLGCQYLLHARKNHRSIRKRSIFYIYISSLAGWLAYIDLVISYYAQTSNEDFVPCAVYYSLSLVIAPLAIGPQLLRAISFWSMFKVSISDKTLSLYFFVSSYL
jgi:hypothetical protein